VDAVDNNGLSGPENQGKSDTDVTHSTQPVLPSEGDQSQSSGSDLARDALRAAQSAARERGGGSRTGAVGKRAGQINRRRRRRWSGARPDDRDPQPLGRLARNLADQRGWQDKLQTGQVFARWSELVGEDIAEHAQPTNLRDGELTVQAESTAWATQIRLLQRQLIAKIAAGVGHNVVKRLKVAGPAAPSWRHGLRHVRGRGPRDTYG
jgi:predicted nucleic acid-binding Zn ribbon protein